VTPAADPIAVAVRVGEILDALGVRHTIGGSIAASFAGEPRSTIDVDFVAALLDRHVAPLVVAATPEFYVAEAALHQAVASRGTANLIHQDSQIKVDLFVAGGTPLDDQQLARRLRVEIMARDCGRSVTGGHTQRCRVEDNGGEYVPFACRARDRGIRNCHLRFRWS
jgi:hypothetical protein